MAVLSETGCNYTRVQSYYLSGSINEFLSGHKEQLIDLLVADCGSCEAVLDEELDEELEVTVWPLELTTATFAKFVFNPNTALKASACAPVPAAALFAAEVADWHKLFASLLALQLVWSCWQMKLAIVPISSAEPWLKDSGCRQWLVTYTL